MEQEVTVEEPKQITLSDNDQTEIVNLVLTAEKKGRDARAKFATDWEECRKLYDCEPEPITDPEMEWQTNLVLPWAYDAVESAYSHLHSTMIPRNDKVFDLVGRTNDDHPSLEVMEKYVVQTLERAKLAEKFGKALKQLLIKNHTCTKVLWRKDLRTQYEWELQPDGVERRVPVEKVVYNGVSLDVIDIDNFVFYPIHGDIEKTTRIHCTYRYLEDLKAAAAAKEAPYFNVDKLVASYEEKQVTQAQLETGEKTYQGIKIKEAWIHRAKIGEKVYKNYIAVIADDKHLIRFQPNPYEGGRSPFIWTQFAPNDDCLYSFGLLSRGKHILKAANFIFNQRLDELKIKLHPPHVYWDDGELNPYNIICRPAAMVRMSQESVVSGNLRPLMQDLGHLTLAYTEVAELKAEFESVTVPKVVKGMIEARSSTATEISHAQNNSSGKLHTLAFHVNETHLKPIIELAYLLNYQQINQDPQVRLDMARVTQESAEQIQDDATGEVVTVRLPDAAMIAKLPQLLPLPEVDVQVVGYQNAVRKQEQAEAMSVALPQLGQSPSGRYLKWDNISELVFETLDLDKTRFLLDEEGRADADQQAEEQAAQQQQAQTIEAKKEMMKLQLQQEKQQQEYEIKLQELELKAMEIQLRYGAQQASMMAKDPNVEEPAA